MRIRPPESPGQERSQPDAASGDAGSHAQGGPADESTRPVDASLIPQGRADDHEEEGDPDFTARVPNVTRMPTGYEVVEHRVGRAVGQWVLHVRCQCGRRWFEVEAIEATTCPRCGRLVYVEIPARGR